MDEVKQPQLYRYEFFGMAQGGVVPQPLVAVVSPSAVDSPEVCAAVDGMYAQLVRQHGIGMVPRPKFYSLTELRELPEADGAAKTPTMIAVARNGGARSKV